MKIFYGSEEYLIELKEEFNKVIKDKEKFERAVHAEGLNEYYSKAMRAYAKKKYEDLFWHASEIIKPNYIVNNGS